ncbi:nucleoid-associated protein [Microbulbifer spongiae]|uniref:Nucleoid-associated protein n=1 Tax=Microbulbifer spongiae TaxID=2944933 RepID=A0ABY9EE08_9GAMM|nr:nucleoid-associated protein [Microbulbifer sp. MI-G]WKD48981.1 nucleoid-associated protein [Microbulbifer sp. MI-G]
MEIVNIIVHEVRKEATDELSVVNPRKKENPVNELTKELSSSLETLFNKTGLMNGGFEEVEEGAPMPRFVEALQANFQNGQFSNFIDFTRNSAYYLADELENAVGSKGGYLLFYHYRLAGKAYLSVIMLRKTAGITLDASLSLSQIERLDLDKLHMAAQINLTDWIDKKSEKYISFKKSGSAKDLTEYFTNFIGCAAYTHARKDTRALIQAIHEYCQEVNMSASEIEATKQRALNYCSRQLDEGKPLWIDQFSAYLDGENPQRFLAITKKEEYQLSNELNLDAPSLIRLRRVSIIGDGMRLTFDSELLHREKIQFDENEGSLLIRELSEAAKKEIKKNL